MKEEIKQVLPPVYKKSDLVRRLKIDFKGYFISDYTIRAYNVKTKGYIKIPAEERFADLIISFAKLIGDAIKADEPFILKMDKFDTMKNDKIITKLYISLKFDKRRYSVNLEEKQPRTYVNEIIDLIYPYIA